MERYVWRRNVELFAGRLATEGDPRSRGMLRMLLIEEENKFGRDAELADLLDTHIHSASVRITEQRQRVALLDGDGGDSTSARRLLGNFEELHDLFVAARKLVGASMESRGL